LFVQVCTHQAVNLVGDRRGNKLSARDHKGLGNHLVETFEERGRAGLVVNDSQPKFDVESALT